MGGRPATTGRGSTPPATSTPIAGTSSSAAATVEGSSPPASTTGTCWRDLARHVDGHAAARCPRARSHRRCPAAASTGSAAPGSRAPDHGPVGDLLGVVVAAARSVVQVQHLDDRQRDLRQVRRLLAAAELHRLEADPLRDRRGSPSPAGRRRCPRSPASSRRQRCIRSARASAASAAASSTSSARRVPGTKFSPIASAPAPIAARRPPDSVMPQIFTNGSRSAAAGSSAADGGRPASTIAATRARTADGSEPVRISSSPTSAPSKPIARQRRRSARLANARLGDHDRGRPERARRSRSARSGSTASVRRSRLLSPIRRASVASAASSSRSSCASTSGSRPRSRAAVTRRRSRAAGCSAASSSTRSAPAARNLRQLPWVDHELLGQDRDRGRRRTAAQIVERAAEPVRLHEHRDGARHHRRHRHARAPRHRGSVAGERSGRGRAPLDLGDQVQTRRAGTAPMASRRASARAASRSRSRTLRLASSRCSPRGGAPRSRRARSARPASAAPAAVWAWWPRRRGFGPGGRSVAVTPRSAASWPAPLRRCASRHARRRSRFSAALPESMVALRAAPRPRGA